MEIVITVGQYIAATAMDELYFTSRNKRVRTTYTPTHTHTYTFF